MASMAVRMPESFVRQARQCADVHMRTVSKQIEYWAMLGRCAEDNPDVPMSFIIASLCAKNEIQCGDTTVFEF